MNRIGIIGAGAWGTALAQVAAAGGEAMIWAREAEVVDSINRQHENLLFLPGARLDPAIVAIGDLEAMTGCDALLVVTPAQHMRAVLSMLPQSATPLVLCAKGIEESSGLLMHEVARDVRPAAPLAILSGPSFAHEVAAGLPTAVTLAAEDQQLGEALRHRLARPGFRPYLSDDVAGAEIGGAVKNVLAIASGVVEGRGLGQNARAALISRGFAEMTRFGLARGARAETLAGLSGLGDLVLTCNSPRSRNMSLGIALGQGESLESVLGARRAVTEGVTSAAAISVLARRLGIDMPIVAAVNRILHEGADIESEVAGLLARPFKAERPFR